MFMGEDGKDIQMEREIREEVEVGDRNVMRYAWSAALTNTQSKVKDEVEKFSLEQDLI